MGNMAMDSLARTDERTDERTDDERGGDSRENQRAALEELQRIPGVGKAVARDLWNLGLRSVDELRGQDPQALYDRLCLLQGRHVDRCMLYTLRCAVYFASTQLPEPELLKWWNWKDRA